jgi:hypothetical protein
MDYTEVVTTYRHAHDGDGSVFSLAQSIVEIFGSSDLVECHTLRLILMFLAHVSCTDCWY